jgi:tetratricopeptide (TPR) repeat protein
VLAAFGWCWLLLALLPSSVTGPRLFMIGDRYAYLPTVGLVLLGYAACAPAADWLAQRWPRYGPRLGVGALALYAGAQALWVVARTADWRSDRTLAEASLRAHPGNPYASYFLGKLALEAWELGRAEPLLLQAARGNPNSWRSHNALCVLRMRQRRLDEAGVACDRTIALNPNNPRAWLNAASVEVNRQRWAIALPHAERALQLKAHFPETHYLGAVSAANLGQLARAQEHLRLGLSQAPGHPRLLDLQRQFEQRR